MIRKSLFAAIALGLSTIAIDAASQAPNKPAGVAGMTAVTPVNQKIGAPVDVYYRHLNKSTGATDPTLQLAFVPRMAGNLRVELVPDKDVTIAYGGAPLALQKAAASGVYNRMLSVRRGGSAPANIRALVSVEIGDMRFFSIYSIPADAVSADAARQKASNKPAAKKRPPKL
jgi:hypothetical protein